MRVICGNLGISQSTGYYWQKIWRANGDQWHMASSRSRSPIGRKPVSAETVGDVYGITKNNPSWGCVRIASELARKGLNISSPTVQKILIGYGRGSKADRLNAVGQISPEDLTPAETNFLTDKSIVRGYVEPGARRGQILVQDSYQIRTGINDRQYRAHLIVDTFDKRIFVQIFHDSDRFAATNLIRQLLWSGTFKIDQIVTGQGPYFGRRKKVHAYKALLSDNQIKHAFLHFRDDSARSRGELIHNAWSAITTGFLLSDIRNRMSVSCSLLKINEELCSWLDREKISMIRKSK